MRGLLPFSFATIDKQESILKILHTKAVIVLNLRSRQVESLNVLDMSKNDDLAFKSSFFESLELLTRLSKTKLPDDSLQSILFNNVNSAQHFSYQKKDHFLYVTNADLTISGNTINSIEAVTVFCWKDRAKIVDFTARSFENTEEGTRAALDLFNLRKQIFSQNKSAVHHNKYGISESFSFGDDSYFIHTGPLIFQGHLTCEDCSVTAADVEDAGCPFEHKHNQKIIPAPLCESCFHKRLQSPVI